ncbi:unnamed protein product [Effrenium voratum]|nr:unnamed protein product [Effrenium voratum]
MSETFAEMKSLMRKTQVDWNTYSKPLASSRCPHYFMPGISVCVWVCATCSSLTLPEVQWHSEGAGASCTHKSSPQQGRLLPAEWRGCKD